MNDAAWGLLFLCIIITLCSTAVLCKLIADFADQRSRFIYNYNRDLEKLQDTFDRLSIVYTNLALSTSNWIAKDQDGEWHFYEHEPVWNKEIGEWYAPGQYFPLYEMNFDLPKSIERLLPEESKRQIKTFGVKYE